jgi:hypothetical protein
MQRVKMAESKDPLPISMRRCSLNFDKFKLRYDKTLKEKINLKEFNKA